jgi:Dolichyl-phosphate-mannose-protein mannosyltransferase
VHQDLEFFDGFATVKASPGEEKGGATAHGERRQARVKPQHELGSRYHLLEERFGLISRHSRRNLVNRIRLGACAIGSRTMRVSEAHATEVAGSARAIRADASRSLARRLPGDPALPVLVVATLTIVGTALRLVVAREAVFGDELSTFWIVTTHGLDGVVSVVHGNAEITPPLYFILSWLTTRIDTAPELLRAPSLLAGAAAIPLTFLLGLRTVGLRAALVAAALAALAPFMIFYSAEGRAYEVVIILALLSTLAMLAAIEDGRARWWVAYGACSCAAVYTHYTVVFALGAQLLWLIWAHPEARKPALLANAGAIVAFLPWLSGVINDFRSPTTDILSALQPLNAHSVRVALEHWSIGYPYAFSTTQLRELPGVAALVLLALGLAVAVTGLVAHELRERPRLRLARFDQRLVLILLLAIATPLGELLVSAVGTNLFGTRNLAVSWPAFALSLAAFVVAAGRWVGLVAAALVIGAFAIGAAKMLEPRFQRPDTEAVASFIDRYAAPGDVVIDGVIFGVSPGPLSGLDVALDRRHRIFRIGAPQQRDRPFGADDRIIPPHEVVRRAGGAARGQRVFMLLRDPGTRAGLLAIAAPLADQLPTGYRRAETRTYRGIIGLALLVYADRASLRG